MSEIICDSANREESNIKVEAAIAAQARIATAQRDAFGIGVPEWMPANEEADLNRGGRDGAVDIGRGEREGLSRFKYTRPLGSVGLGREVEAFSYNPDGSVDFADF